MSADRVKCLECDRTILPETAAANAGLCAACARVPPELRQESREYRRRLTAGELFVPSDAELRSAKQPPEFGNPCTKWELEPEYYADQEPGSVPEIIERAFGDAEGNVFLVSSLGSRLNLSFTVRYGVCEYQNEDAGDYLYACTHENLRRQVEAAHHVVQACPCCGEGTLWYPSRFHMSRDAAFAIIKSLTANVVPSGVLWLEGGDISHTSRGEG